MSNITPESLHARRAALVKQQNEHRAMVHVCDGGIQEIDRLIAELANPAAGKVPKPPAADSSQT